MQIREFTPSDLASMNRWLKRWGHTQVQQADLPFLGFVVPGVAMAFIRQCEGGIGIFDSMVSNSRCSPATRNKALDALVAHIKLKTELMGIKSILAFTTDASVLERAARHGFKQLQHHTITYTAPNKG